ncbi:Aste57867_3118 [Aphanomyces stellatus]|uniref:Aste57867_3118 protein n=1 Tax=Aphanomyces stellatus TaxID=120398 RepID=A0A485KE98_9STRA|nr:hypothetical protein As57867_003109 [Aphanomyces stellatus]VFT80294.1 Aste57867_3118 [Aphanomyces stellatus]
MCKSELKPVVCTLSPYPPPTPPARRRLRSISCGKLPRRLCVILTFALPRSQHTHTMAYTTNHTSIRILSSVDSLSQERSNMMDRIQAMRAKLSSVGDSDMDTKMQSLPHPMPRRQTLRPLLRDVKLVASK